MLSPESSVAVTSSFTSASQAANWYEARLLVEGSGWPLAVQAKRFTFPSVSVHSAVAATLVTTLRAFFVKAVLKLAQDGAAFGATGTTTAFSAVLPILLLATTVMV